MMPDGKDTIISKRMLSFYTKYKECFKFGHININNVRHKFGPLRDALTSGMLDMLFIQETKLDDGFLKSQFEVPGFKMYRRDHSSNKGGIMMLMRNDIAHKRREELENVCDN